MSFFVYSNQMSDESLVKWALSHHYTFHAIPLKRNLYFWNKLFRAYHCACNKILHSSIEITVDHMDHDHNCHKAIIYSIEPRLLGPITVSMLLCCLDSSTLLYHDKRIIGTNDDSFQACVNIFSTECSCAVEWEFILEAKVLEPRTCCYQ